MGMVKEMVMVLELRMVTSMEMASVGLLKMVGGYDCF